MNKNKQREQEYEAFKKEWMAPILNGNPNTIQLGGQFAAKLVQSWLDLQEDDVNFYHCDGSGDGGIDAAYWQGTESNDDQDGFDGETWYLVQSKYGRAFKGPRTIIEEGNKVIDTLVGNKSNLTSLNQAGLTERLQSFWKGTSNQNRIILVFATDNPLKESHRNALEEVRTNGAIHLGDSFQVEEISLKTLYDRMIPQPVWTNITVHLAQPISTQANFVVGSASLSDFFCFIKEHENQTHDHAALYEKNVRQYNKTRKTNREIKSTLEKTPENFGLFNNGITIVAREWKTIDGISHRLLDPYVVNGCQTANTIREVFNVRMGNGWGNNKENEAWRSKVSQSQIAIKIVRVGTESAGEELTNSITRFTNSQTAIRGQDFLTLNPNFRQWQKEFKAHRIYLEIQRDAWTLIKARQSRSSRRRVKTQEYTDGINAFKLIKVYGAGWFGFPGIAFNKNAPFESPNGEIFKKIIEDESFGERDLLACYHLHKLSQNPPYSFSKKVQKESRKLTRFLFYFVSIQLLRHALLNAGRQSSCANVTAAFHQLRDSPTGELDLLLNLAATVIDDYMDETKRNSAFKEPSWNGNLNHFLKSDDFARSEQDYPRLWNLLDIQSQYIEKHESSVIEKLRDSGINPVSSASSRFGR